MLLRFKTSMMMQCLSNAKNLRICRNELVCKFSWNALLLETSRQKSFNFNFIYAALATLNMYLLAKFPTIDFNSYHQSKYKNSVISSLSRYHLSFYEGHSFTYAALATLNMYLLARFPTIHFNSYHQSKYKNSVISSLSHYHHSFYEGHSFLFHKNRDSLPLATSPLPPLNFWTCSLPYPPPLLTYHLHTQTHIQTQAWTHTHTHTHTYSYTYENEETFLYLPNIFWKRIKNDNFK